MKILRLTLPAVLLVSACSSTPQITSPTRTPTTAPQSPSRVSPEPTRLPDPTYAFPVEPISVARYSQGHHDYPATDIFCPEGSRFIAVTSGVVDFVSRVDRWDPNTNEPPVRGGVSVAIVGDDGVRYYGSHLSAIADGIEAGTRVETGDLLGLTGDSGNAQWLSDDLRYHLHFGISRPTHPTDWEVRRGEVDPYPYLEAWKRGENKTPKLSS